MSQHAGALVLGLQNTYGHGVQLGYTTTNTGFVRVYIEHWHGSANVTTGTLSITKTVGAGPGVTQNIFGTGTIQNTAKGSLPFGFTRLSGCSDENRYNDWAYFDFAPGTCDEPLTIRINGGNNFFLSGACGLYGKTIPTQTFTDQAPPVITAPDVNVVSTDCGPVGIASFPISVVDACDPNPSVTVSHSPGIFPVGTTTVTVTATDNKGFTSIATFNVNVTTNDTTAPAFTSVPANATVECDAVPAVGGATASDVCDPNPLVTYLGQIVSAQSCTGSYTLTRSWKASDASGNSSIASQVITVQDNTAPSLVGVPVDVTVQCDNVPGPASPSASDNCDPNPGVNLVEIITPGTCAGNYLITRTWTATDDCGNSRSASQVITVEDTTAPALAGVPADVDSQPESVPAAASPTASDNCDPAPVVTLAETIIAGSCAGSYTLTRTWTATDECGNTSSASQVITVDDTIAPILAGVPADVTVECDSVPDAASPTATDSFDPAPVVSLVETITAGNCDGDYILTRTWTATDECGNSSSGAQIVTVQDTTAPIVGDIASNLTVECDGAGNSADLTAWLTSNGGASASDNCGGVTWSNNFAALSDDCGATGAATVTFTATDGCGNATTTAATFTIEDTVAPSIDTASSSVTVECDGFGNVDQLDAWLSSNGSASASDACSGVTWSNDFAALSDDCGATGSATVIFTATDDCGNSTTTTATFTIEDTTAPDLSSDANDIFPYDAPVTFTVATGDICGDTDLVLSYDCHTINGGGKIISKLGSCEIVIVGNQVTILDSGGVGTIITISATATDACNNQTSDDFVVNVLRPANEGLGNGVDGNTPGHDNNGGNDDPEFEPGNPGAKGKNK